MKRIFALALMLCLFATPAWAQEHANHDAYTAISAAGKYSGDLSGEMHYYLANDIDGSLEFGQSVVLCLNGHTITGAAGADAVKVYHGSFVLCDCEGSGVITHGVDADGKKENGRGVYVDDGGMTMTGGTITGNTVQDHGAGVYLRMGSMTMAGGTISNNEAEGSKNGGGVCAKGVVMTGGTISGNSAVYGGGVYTTGDAKISGGTISGNTARSYGGGVCVDDKNKKALILENALISGNHSIDGGGVYSYGDVEISGGTISGNTADYDGGGVYADGDVTIAMGTISGNAARNGGGVHASDSASEIVVYSGTIDGNTATKDGGGVCARNGGVFVMGNQDITRITNNAAASRGGAACANTGMSISGGTITGNTAPYGAVYAISADVSVLNNPKIADNFTPEGKACNVYLKKGSSNKEYKINSQGMTAGAKIGVTTQDVPSLGRPVPYMTGVVDDAAMNATFSDNAAYIKKKRSGGDAALYVQSEVPAPRPRSLTFTGVAQALIESDALADGVMQYALGDREKATGDWSSNIPEGTDVGAYYVWYRIPEDDRYLGTAAACVTAVIAQAQTAITAAADKTEYIYGETVKIKVTVQAASASAKNQTAAFAAPEAGEVSLWKGKTQIAEPQAAGLGDVVTFELDTLAQGFTPGSYTLTVKYAESNNMTAQTATVSFVVKELATPSLPTTGDASLPMSALLTILLTACAGTCMLRRKRA